MKLTFRKRASASILAFVAFLAVHLAPLAMALAADEFEPLNEATRQRMDPNPYLLAAYGFIWAAVLIYVVMLARGMGRARADLEALQRRLDASGR
jgi:hypothetical protein